MSESNTYTTGQVAQLCSVSVRTVQYYDRKGLLSPTSVTSTGRRLYNETAVRSLEYILMLKETGLSLAAIHTVLESPYSTNMLSDILGQQRDELAGDIEEATRKIAAIDALNDDLNLHGTLTMADRTDMADYMANTSSSRRFFTLMLVVGILADVVWIGTLVWAILTHTWIIFIIGLVITCAMLIPMTWSYYNHVVYWDPASGKEFKPRFWPWFFAAHTLHTRKLKAPGSSEKTWCVEHFRTTPQTK